MTLEECRDWMRDGCPVPDEDLRRWGRDWPELPLNAEACCCLYRVTVETSYPRVVASCFECDAEIEIGFSWSSLPVGLDRYLTSAISEILGWMDEQTSAHDGLPVHQAFSFADHGETFRRWIEDMMLHGASPERSGWYPVEFEKGKILPGFHLGKKPWVEKP